MRAQVGLEYAAIMILFLLVLVPTALYLYQNAAINASVAQAELAVTKLAAAADAVKASAPGAKLTVEVYVPGRVNVSQAAGREILFRVHSSEGKLTDAYRVTAANLTQATFPTAEGVLVLEVVHDASGNVTFTQAR